MPRRSGDACSGSIVCAKATPADPVDAGDDSFAGDCAVDQDDSAIDSGDHAASTAGFFDRKRQCLADSKHLMSSRPRQSKVSAGRPKCSRSRRSKASSRARVNASGLMRSRNPASSTSACRLRRGGHRLVKRRARGLEQTTFQLGQPGQERLSSFSAKPVGGSAGDVEVRRQPNRSRDRTLHQWSPALAPMSSRSSARSRWAGSDDVDRFRSLLSCDS